MSYFILWWNLFIKMVYMMFINKRISLERVILIFILSAASIVLSSAILLGEFLNAAPCELCMYQRIPYFIIIIITLISLTKRIDSFIKPKIICILSSLLVMSSAIIATYHVGVEQGYFETSCAPTEPPNFSLENVREALKSPIEPLCNNLSIEFLGISMAGYNAMFSFLLSFLLILLAFQNRYWK